MTSQISSNFLVSGGYTTIVAHILEKKHLPAQTESQFLCLCLLLST